MTTIRRIVTSKIDGNDANANNIDEIRPFGETAFYLDTEQNNALTLMMFDGVRTHRRSKILRPGVFYGSNENSSDGNGFDTIKLIPDAALDFNAEYTNDQYIIIEPTGGEPGHVHIRSGGTIDQSTADLFIGGELNHVKVSDTSDTVTISTDASGGNANTVNEWAFGSDGNIIFPDGSVQTTAFAGFEPVSKFVAVNYEGVISGSDDGITWTDYQSNLNNIRRVAVGPNKIVYIAASSTNTADYSLWYADTYDTQPIEVAAFDLRDFAEVKYFKSISKFIAVGDDGANPANPALYYSTNGVDWTMSTIDPTYLATFETYTGGVRFTDIAENSSGFFVISDIAYIGGFYLSDITEPLDGSNHVDLSGLAGDPQDILWLDSTFFFPGWHLFAEGEGLVWYENSNINPSTGTFTDNGLNINSIMTQEIGINSGPVEFVAGTVSGLSVVMISTSDGQIVYWPAVPAGPYVSVPKPYTSTITAWTDSATSAITYTNVTGGGGSTGEKFIVTGSSVTGYNGTYYLGAAGAVFTNRELTTAFDTSALDPFTGTATISWSNGQYIDALHYSGGIFYAGNDDEEVFISTNAGQTWTQVDTLANTSGEGSFLNDIDSYVTNGLLNTGNITFNGVEIRGIPSEMKTGLIKLVPATSYEDYNFTDYGQFVQIYPTNLYDAPHIHIAAGTGQFGEGDIFLGDDNKHVQVNNQGYVSIQSYNSNTALTYTWSFDDTGTLTLPSNSAITSAGEMRIRTTRTGFDIDTNFDVESADDVFIDALGNDARLGAANIVRIRSGTSVMYPTVWLGQGDPADFTGTWDGNTLTIVVANGPTTLITLLDYYTTSDAPIWIKTASGYVETDNNNTTTKTVGETTTTFEIPTSATSPAENASVLKLKLYDSVNSLGEGGHTWTFEKNGDLTLPAGGDIVNSTGVSQTAQRMEGSWTLPDDTTDTYSFTLPSDGTYIMWVKGNIPNGIITWNATASVTNTNVPAIGSQYAWNYTGGGSPILLTALPDQIRGTAGAISTDATYAGTTSNRFDFEISNTSGSNQTVYWGYTKI